MARKGRVDTAGAVHHIIQRGNDRGAIFLEDADYANFVSRMASNLIESKTRCFAWSLMPNHIHLVLATGERPIKTVLQCIFTGYAMGINKKYGRSGHLFQGRYNSILCEEETYLLELVRYVHLNPVKAGITDSIEELAKYRWTGHRALLGLCDNPWQVIEEVLRRFGPRFGPAREKYISFLDDGLKRPMNNDEITGKGMRRIKEGGWESVSRKVSLEDTYADERIAGSREFIEKVLKDVEEKERWRSKMLGHGWTPERVIERAAKQFGLKVADLRGNGKRPVQCSARNLACKWLVDGIGKSEVEVSQLLSITQPTVSGCVRKGRLLEKSGGYKLER